MRPMAQRMAREAVAPSGGRLVAVDGRVLPLTGVGLRAEARGGIARVTLEQRFTNPYTEPLRVSYQVPLPPDGALAGYTIRLGERRIIGEVDRLAAARERFEEALLDGRSAGLVEQDRPNLFTQEIGNIPPGAEVVVELQVDQRLLWLSTGAWEWRFPTVAAPRFLGAEGQVPDAERVAVDVAEQPLDVAVAAELAIRDTLLGEAEPKSPSHAIDVRRTADAVTVSLGEGAARLDRDLVVRWPVAGPAVGLHLDVGRPAAGRPHARSAYGLVTIVPPARGHEAPRLARDLIVLIDTSGSMDGGPLDQARLVVAGLVESLGEADRLELIEFSDRPRRWRPDARPATPAARADARAWLAGLRAHGGTQMDEGIAEALRPLRPEAQRQVVLLTDGLVGFEDQIVAAVAQRLPSGSRLHVVGIGPSVNRGLSGRAARAGRGAEVLVGLDEEAGPAIERLLCHLTGPLVMDLELAGSALVQHAPSRIPHLHAEMPVRVAAALRPEGGELTVRGRTPSGPWEGRVVVPAVAAGGGSPAVVALYGREAVEDLELDRLHDTASAVDPAIERIGLDFQIATRLTSWVAVSEESTVDPTAPIRRERIPHMLPAGLSAEGLGLRRAMPVQYRTARSVFAASADSLVQRRASGGAPESTTAYDRAPSPRRAARRMLRGFYDPPGAGLALSGRISRRSDRELVVEIPVELPFHWEPRSADVVWGTDPPRRTEILQRATTRPGPASAGTVLRLVLRLPADRTAGAPAQVIVMSGGVKLTVNLAG